MLVKPKTAAATNSPVAAACGNCAAEDTLLLLNVRHHGTFRRLCTTCVLRLHPQSFCPTCFEVYPPPSPNDAVLTCFKCYSSTHSRCVAAPHPAPYICPLCIDPKIPIFKLKQAKEANVEGLSVESNECRVMDGEAAKKFLAAAKIVSASMNKAEAAVKAEAERRAKEAAFTRKRAKEALDYVAHLVMKEKLRKKEEALQPSGLGIGGVGRNVVYGDGGFTEAKANPVIMEAKANPVIMEAKINVLNAVELRENEKTGGMKEQRATSRMATDEDHVVVMDVDEKGRVMVNAGENVGGLIAEWSDSDIDQILFSDEENFSLQGEKQE